MQIFSVGPANSLSLCRSTSLFYRMKDRIEKAQNSGEAGKVPALERRKEAAKAGIGLAAERMCERVAKRAGKAGMGEAAALASKEAIVDRMTSLSERARPWFAIEKATAGGAVVVALAGLVFGSVDALEGAGLIAALAAVMAWQSFAEFVYGAADKLLPKKLTSEQSSLSARSS